MLLLIVTGVRRWNRWARMSSACVANLDQSRGSENKTCGWRTLSEPCSGVDCCSPGLRPRLAWCRRHENICFQCDSDIVGQLTRSRGGGGGIGKDADPSRKRPHQFVLFWRVRLLLPRGRRLRHDVRRRSYVAEVFKHSSLWLVPDLWLGHRQTHGWHCRRARRSSPCRFLLNSRGTSVCGHSLSCLPSSPHSRSVSTRSLRT